VVHSKATARRQRPTRKGGRQTLTLLRGGGTKEDNPPLTPGAAECAQLARELYAECSELLVEAHGLARLFPRTRRKPEPGSDLSGKARRSPE
jgi:hypothetical protein